MARRDASRVMRRAFKERKYLSALIFPSKCQLASAWKNLLKVRNDMPCQYEFRSSNPWECNVTCYRDI